MHYKIFFFALVFKLSGGLSAQDYIVKPKLVVAVVVDQMRYDYITRYWDNYSDGGFKRLVGKGYNFSNAHFNYIPTFTAPGHASIFTGTTPRVHGIVGNDFFDKSSNKMVYCVEDAKVNTVGSNSQRGKMSPKALLTTTFSDQLKLHHSASKVIGLSLKDRGAILPVGHNADAAYWFDTEKGKWITSTYYLDKLPEWLEKINNSEPTKKAMQEKWQLLYPIEKYTSTLPDSNAYEHIFLPKKAPSFPYAISALEEAKLGFGILKVMPFGNDILKDLAIATIQNEQLGSDNTPDFLSISFSATDGVGHRFGPHSLEIEDTYLRLDRNLEELFDVLDVRVGEGEYLLFLTADHAAAPNPIYMQDVNIPAGIIKEELLLEGLNAFLAKELGDYNWIKNLSNNQIFLREELLKLEEVEVAIKAIKDYLLSQKGIANVFSRSEVEEAGNTTFPLNLLHNGYHQKLSGDILYTLEPGWMHFEEKGTTHGSGYSYDTHVPLIFYGTGVSAGKSSQRVDITQIAPTISDMMGVQFPNGCFSDPVDME